MFGTINKTPVSRKRKEPSGEDVPDWLEPCERVHLRQATPSDRGWLAAQARLLGLAGLSAEEICAVLSDRATPWSSALSPLHIFAPPVLPSHALSRPHIPSSALLYQSDPLGVSTPSAHTLSPGREPKHRRTEARPEYVKDASRSVRSLLDDACWSRPTRDPRTLLDVVAQILPPEEFAETPIARDPDSPEAYDATCLYADRALTRAGISPALPQHYGTTETFPPLRWTWLQAARDRLQYADCENLTDIFADEREIASGRYGTVLAVRFRDDPNGYPVAIKRQPRNQRNDASVRRELSAMAITSDLVIDNLTPNFGLLFHECTLRRHSTHKEEKEEEEEEEAVAVIEFADGTLDDEMRRLLEEAAAIESPERRAERGAFIAQTLLSLTVQVLLGGVAALAYIDMQHRDLHGGNVLVNRVEPVWHNYRAFGRDWLVPILGMLARVADLGVAKSTRTDPPSKEGVVSLLDLVWFTTVVQAIIEEDIKYHAYGEGVLSPDAPEIQWIAKLTKAVSDRESELKSYVWDPKLANYRKEERKIDATDLLTQLASILWETDLQGILAMYRPSPHDRILYFNVDAIGERTGIPVPGSDESNTAL